MALQRKLRSNTLLSPPIARTRATAPGARDGTVSASFPGGEVFLRRQEGSSYRLSWQKAGTELPLPAGTYQFLGYRLSKKGWLLSTTSPGQRRIVVKTGQPTRLGIKAGVEITLRARLRRGGLSLAAMVQGDQGLGASIYQQGKRLPLPYQLEDSQGKVLLSGTMRYG